MPFKVFFLILTFTNFKNRTGKFPIDSLIYRTLIREIFNSTIYLKNLIS